MVVLASIHQDRRKIWPRPRGGHCDGLRGLATAGGRAGRWRRKDSYRSTTLKSAWSILVSVGCPCLVGDPVHFPGLAAVTRECLFEVGRIGGHARPFVANEDGLAVDRVLGEELTASILEGADLGRVHDAVLA